MVRIPGVLWDSYTKPANLQDDDDGQIPGVVGQRSIPDQYILRVSVCVSE